MRGGVSLAVWMGGACQEIEALRRSARSQPGQAASKVYRALLDRADYNKVVVDVLAGTSAGGLNAVLLSCALLYDMPFDAHVRDLWLRISCACAVPPTTATRSPCCRATLSSTRT